MCYQESPNTDNHEKIKEFINDILTWKHYNAMLYPDDVLNMLLERKILHKYEMDAIVSNYTPQHWKLPEESI